MILFVCLLFVENILGTPSRVLQRNKYFRKVVESHFSLNLKNEVSKVLRKVHL